MCMWFPMYPWVGLLIVVRFLRSALECHYALLWYLVVSTGTVTGTVTITGTVCLSRKEK